MNPKIKTELRNFICFAVLACIIMAFAFNLGSCYTAGRAVKIVTPNSELSADTITNIVLPNLLKK